MQVYSKRFNRLIAIILTLLMCFSFTPPLDAVNLEVTKTTSSAIGSANDTGGSTAPGTPVQQRTVTSVSPLTDLVVDYGTTLTEPQLPGQVDATLSDSTTVKASVQWDTSSYQATVPGSYTLAGTLTDLSSGVDNTAGLKDKLEVTVKQANITSVNPLGSNVALETPVSSLLLQTTTKSILNDNSQKTLPQGYIYNQDGIGFSGIIASNPLKDNVSMTSYNPWSTGTSDNVNFAFEGGIFDGQNIWMVPHNADRVLKINKDSGKITSYNAWPLGFNKEEQSFSGGVFDGQSIWLVPYRADRVIKVDKDTGEMTSYDAWPSGINNIGNYAFNGGVFDGENIWLIPWNADRLIKINKDTGEMTSYNSWPTGITNIGNSPFCGGVFDGQNIWLVPHRTDRLIKVNKDTGEMTSYNAWPSGISNIGNGAFAGGMYDGQNIWLIPHVADLIVKIDKDTGEMTSYNAWPSGISNIGIGAFDGGAFDGQNIWLVPRSSNQIIKINKDTGVMTGYNNWPSDVNNIGYDAFSGGVFDGQNIWLVPANADKIVKISNATSSSYTVNAIDDPSQGKWLNTNLWLEAHQSLTINASGQGAYGPSSWFITDPDGNHYDRDILFPDKIYDPSAVLSSAPIGTLIGAFMDLEGNIGQPIQLGSKVDIIAPTSGYFLLAYNDTPNGYYDNYGNYLVNVKTAVDDINFTNISAGESPWAVAINPITNKIYVANYHSNNVTVIDGENNTTDTVATGTGPWSLAVNSVTNKIYVMNWGSDYITVIDGTNNATENIVVGLIPREIVANTDLMTDCNYIAVNPVTNKIYVVNDIGNSVTVIDGRNNTTETITAGTNPGFVAVNPITNKIYVSNYNSNNVTIISGDDNTTDTINVGTEATAIAVNHVTNKIYVGHMSSGNVTVIDGENNTTSTIATGTYTWSIAVNSITNKIYVVNGFGNNYITVIDGSNNTTETVDVGIDPQHVALNPVTNKIFVTNYFSNDITLIDGLNNRTETISAGTKPYAVAVNTDTNKTYVTNSGSNDVTVIDIIGNMDAPAVSNVQPSPPIGSAGDNFTITANVTNNPDTVFLQFKNPGGDWIPEDECKGNFTLSKTGTNTDGSSVYSITTPVNEPGIEAEQYQRCFRVITINNLGNRNSDYTKEYSFVVRPKTENDEVYQASIGFSNAQGQNNWYYEEQRSDGEYYQLTWNADIGRWQGTYYNTQIWSVGQHPDSFDSIRTWKAPHSGTINISSRVFKGDTGGGDGVNVKIMKNTTQLWPISGWQNITYDDSVGFNINQNIQVNNGDSIHFELNQNSSVYFDSTHWDPVITYLNNFDNNSPILSNIKVSPTSGFAGDSFSIKANVTNNPVTVFLQFKNPGGGWISEEECKSEFALSKTGTNPDGSSVYSITLPVSIPGIEAEQYKRYFRVIAVNQAGIRNSDYSKEYSLMVRPKVNPPVVSSVQPSPLSGYAGDSFTITANVTNNPDIVYLQLKNPGGDWISEENCKVNYILSQKGNNPDGSSIYSINLPVNTPGIKAEDYKRLFRVVAIKEGIRNNNFTDEYHLVVKSKGLSYELKVTPQIIVFTNENKDPIQLKVTCINDDGTEKDVTSEIKGLWHRQDNDPKIKGYWYSNDPPIAMVDDNGRILPTLSGEKVVNGNTQIVITYGEQALKVPVSSSSGNTLRGQIVNRIGSPVKAVIKTKNASVSTFDDGSFSLANYSKGDVVNVEPLDEQNYFSQQYKVPDSLNEENYIYDVGEIKIWQNNELPIVLVPGTFASWSDDGFYKDSKGLDPENDGFYTKYQRNGKLKWLIEKKSRIIGDSSDTIGRDQIHHIFMYNNNEYRDLEISRKERLWYLDPIQDSYTDFLKELESNNYKKESQNKGYFVFCYDNLKTPIEKNGNYLNEYINKIKNYTGAPKVNLVTHSQGGLVSRYYIQNLEGYNNVNNFVMAGVPNQGIILADSVWDGGQDDKSIDQALKIETVDMILGILLETNSQETKRRLATEISSDIKNPSTGGYLYPSLNQMLPTFDYLRDYSLELDNKLNPVLKDKKLRRNTGDPWSPSSNYPMNPFLVNLNRNLGRVSKMSNFTLQFIEQQKKDTLK